MKQQAQEGQREREGEREADPDGMVQNGVRENWRIELSCSSSCILKEERCIAALPQNCLVLAGKSQALLAWPPSTAGRVALDPEQAKSIFHLSQSYSWGGTAEHWGCDGTTGLSQY